MTMPCRPSCNLACEHCYCLKNKLYPERSTYQMSEATLETRVVNTLQTNGNRLDDERCEFLADEEFLVGISLEGPRDPHDRYRRTKAHGPIFDRAMKSLALLQKHNVEYNVLCVLNEYNSRYPERVYGLFKD